MLAYISNAAAAGNLQTVDLDFRAAHTVQPYAVGRESKSKQLAGRLLDAIRSAESKKRFEGVGFRWLVPGEDR